MKHYFILPLLLSLIFVPQLTFADWEWQSLGGGNAEKIIAVDENGPTGIWFFCKDGGAHWVQTDGDGTYSDWQGFDEWYAWHMGGDVLMVDSEWHCLNVTMQGHHIYQYDGDNEWAYDVSNPMVRNAYFQWHDGAFIKDDTNPVETDKIMVTSWQCWAPYNVVDDYPLGLYQIINGARTIIDGNNGNFDTQDLSYSKIYRDPTDDNLYYTWYHDPDGTPECDFQNVEITDNSGNFEYTFTTDFDESADDRYLKEITAFYQYLDASSVIHQYLLATTVDDNEEDECLDVWLREGTSGNLAGDGWSRIWYDVDDDGNARGVSGWEYDDTSDYHYIYVMSNAGLLQFDSDPNATNQPIVMTDDGTDYILSYKGQQVCLTPWRDSNDGHLVFSTAHGGNFFCEIDWDAANPLIDVKQNDGWDNHSPADNVKGGLSVRGKGGTYYDGSNIYLCTWQNGFFKVTTDIGAFEYSQIGYGNDNDAPLNYADFNFQWNCCVRSPWESDVLYLGANNWPFEYGGDQNNGGLWSLDEDHDPYDNYLDNEVSGKSITALETLERDQDKYLFIGASDNTDDDEFFPEEQMDWTQPSELLIKSNQALSSEYTANYGYDIYPSFLGGGPITAYPEFNCLKGHPNPDVTGVICGMGLPFCDWAGYYADPDPHETDHKGGGIAIVYYESGDWENDLIVDFEDNAAATYWFEHVFDMVVEHNDYSTGNYEDYEEVDILAATAAWQLEHGTEDIWRYGGLFRVIPDGSGGWGIGDVTPSTSNYQLDDLTTSFDHPAVLSIEKYHTSDGDYFYVCSTSGEKRNSQDEHLSLLWYQRAANMRGLTRGGWQLYPNPGGEDGIISYTNANNDEGFSEWYEGIVIIDEAKIMVGVGPWTIWGESIYDDIDGGETWTERVTLMDTVVI